MKHLGLICPELSGHLNPMTTLGRELQRRGHKVTLLARPDAERKARSAGLHFAPMGAREFPLGAMPEQVARLGKMSGLKAMRFTAEMLRMAAVVTLRDATEVINREKIDAVLVDQVSLAGNTAAQVAGKPFITVCNALALQFETSIPPAVLPWKYRNSLFGRLRNRLGYALLDRLASPVIQEINRYRENHGLGPLTKGVNDLSNLAQIAQQPAFFDFPRAILPDCFHYTGPWHDAASGDETDFPWDKLDGRPLVYASMGTLQNRLEVIFQTIAAACAGLDVQLVLSLGSRDQDLAKIASRCEGNPLIVSYAPQLALLKKATLSITHAGLNTALESIAQGLPMVAIPITNDQPGVAARLEWLGLAEVVPPRKLSVSRLRNAIERVLNDERFRENARQRQVEISQQNGLCRAANLVENALKRVVLV